MEFNHNDSEGYATCPNCHQEMAGTLITLAIKALKDFEPKTKEMKDFLDNFNLD